MKKILSTIWLFLKSLTEYLWLDRISILFFVLALILNIILWIYWRQNSYYSLKSLYLTSGVLIINLFLALFVARRERLTSMLLAGTAFSVQVLILIYFKYFLSLVY